MDTTEEPHMSTTLRILLVVALAIVAFAAVLGSAYAQGGTATATAMAMTATPGTLPTTGGPAAVNTLTVVLLGLGATAGLGGLLLRGLRRSQ
jgi:hypothetical protein